MAKRGHGPQQYIPEKRKHEMIKQYRIGIKKSLRKKKGVKAKYAYATL